MQEDLRSGLKKIGSMKRLQTINDTSSEKLAELQFESSRETDCYLVPEVQGYQFGFVTNVLASRDVQAAFLNCSKKDIHETYLKCMQHRISPRIIADAPCQEAVLTDEKIDLRILPAVKFNCDDVGPYITGGLIIGRDVVDGFANVSYNRMQVKGKDRLGICLGAGTHLDQMQKRAEEVKKDLPVAICLGSHPAEMLAAATSLKLGEDEMEVAGAIRGRAVEMVKAKTVDVNVPATSEIVIEGYIPYDTREMEGPFGDFMGFYMERDFSRIVKVTAITYRKDKPLYQSIRAGSLEDCILLGLEREINIYRALKQKDINVLAVNSSPMVFSYIVQIDKRDDAEAGRAIDTAFEVCPWLKYCIVVDDDVDCYDLNDVWWAVATRCSPASVVIDPAAQAYLRDPAGLHKGRLGMDATMKMEFRHELRRARP